VKSISLTLLVFVWTAASAQTLLNTNSPYFLEPAFEPHFEVPHLEENRAREVSGSEPLPLGSESVTQALPSSLSSYLPDDKYKLRPGDKVSLQILEDRDAAKTLLVTDSGELDVPYIGRVAAADKTCKQFAEEFKQQLEKDYYYRATVILALDTANRLLGRVYIWGQVRNQGAIDLAMNENLTAGKAILRLGGFGDFANKKKVKVVRTPVASGSARQTFELNMIEILEQGMTEKDLLLRPDDLIIVPSRLINF